MRVEFYQDWEPFSEWPWEEIDPGYLAFIQACSGADDKWRSSFTPEQVEGLEAFEPRFGFGRQS